MHFVDTNVLIYAIGDDAKVSAARALIGSEAVISVQVLAEFANVLKKKLGFALVDIEELSRHVQSVCEVVDLTPQTHRLSLKLAERYQIGIYDAQIAASAMLAGCETLYSEDFQHGLNLRMAYQNLRLKVTVRNPFL